MVYFNITNVWQILLIILLLNRGFYQNNDFMCLPYFMTDEPFQDHILVISKILDLIADS